MLFKPIDDIKIEDFETLVENRISEHRRMEFKRDHYGRKDDDRREFAADVSAMANSNGRDLIIGIAEVNGAASKLTCVDASDPDSLVLAIIDALRSSIEPPISGIRVIWIEKSPGLGLILIRIPRSWNAPHRVTVAKDNRFFIRDENGKHPMSVDELRQSFLFGTEIENRLRNFRDGRLKLLMANEGPLAVASDKPCLILHFVPLSALTNPRQIEFEPHRVGIRPMGATGWNEMYSIDGRVTYSGPEDKFETVRSFSTFFRSGIIEAVGTIHIGERNGTKTINLNGIEQEAARFLGNGIKECTHYQLEAPFYFMLSVAGVRGVAANLNDWHSGLAYPHRSDNVLLPELRIEAAQLGNTQGEILLPIFNLLWNAFGQHGSPNIAPSQS